MNHAAFYDKMKRIAETMIKKQKNEGLTASAVYLEDIKNNGFTGVDIEDEKDKYFLRDFLLTITYHSDSDVIVNHCLNKLADYLNDNTLMKKLTEAKNKTSYRKMNHAAFYNRMKRMAETMTDLQKEHGYGNIAVAEYLRDTKYSREFTDIDIEDEKDREFLKDFLSPVSDDADSDDIANHCFKKLNYYLDDNIVKKETTKTSHKEMIELAKHIRGGLVSLREFNASDDYIATITFSIINNLKSKLPVEDNNDDRFIKQMVEISHNYSGPKLVDNLIATIDYWYEFKVEDSNLLSIDELSKKISNKKKMDKENVGYTILCEMKNLVEKTTIKLADNIEEEDFSNSLDKRLINRDLQSLLNSYSNILEILGQYYVKLEK